MKENEDFLDEELEDEIESQELPDEEELDNDGDDLDDNYDDLDSYGGDFDGGESPLTKHNDLLKSLTDFEPYLKDLFNNWLGLRWSEEKKEFIEDKLITPVMNVNCAMWCLRFLKNYARKNNIITDISSTDYKNIQEDIINELWYNLGTRDDFGITQEGDLIAICTELEHSATLALMGAGDGRYNKFLGTTISRSESIQLSENNNQPQVQVAKQSTGSKLKKLIVG